MTDEHTPCHICIFLQVIYVKLLSQKSYTISLSMTYKDGSKIATKEPIMFKLNNNGGKFYQVLVYCSVYLPQSQCLDTLDCNLHVLIYIAPIYSLWIINMYNITLIIYNLICNIQHNWLKFD